MVAIRSALAGLILGFAGIAFADSPVNINTASAEMLAEAITGVGLKKAQSIIEYREQHGPFGSVDELVAVRGIGETTVDKSRDNLMVGE